MAGMTADEVYVLLGDEITLLTEEVKQMEGWEPIEHKGTVQTAEDLPTDAKKGWMYNIATDSVYGAAGMNVVMTSKGWDPMGPIINMNLYLTKEEGAKSFQPKGNYLSGTDTDLKESGKAADAKVTGKKIAKNSSDIAKKLDKNQGSENSGKVAGINEVGDIVPMFPMGVEYNSETNCLEFGSDQKMKLNQGIGLDNTLTKSGSAADAGVTGKKIDSLKEDVTNIKVDVTKIRTEVTKIQEDHTNLFNKDAVTKGAVLSENGYFETGFSSWDSSDYIPVKPGMVLYFSSNELPIGVVSTGAYFDADKKYLSGINNEPTVLTVPDGAYYLRFSKNGGLGDTLNTLKIEQHGITKFTPYGELYITANESALPSSILPKWKGLKILTLGDSITAMGGANGWTYWIKQYLLADKVVNVSVAGSTWQDKVANQTYDGNPQPSTDGNVMGNQVQKVLNAKANGDADYQDFDVITFSFGTNDSVDFSLQTKESVESQFITNYAQNNFTVVPLESVNRQTLAGAIRYGFQKLHEAYPNAVIFMCTPTQECYETFDSIYQKGDFINFVADRLGAETIDTRRCGIRNIYESQTTIDYDHPEQSGVAPIQTDLLDGIHTNENGAKKIAKYNAREIMKYFMIN